jgi:3-deoxy-manno-octulosonate cytidylyltransferase (CMP-KDO synthetase)
MKIGIIPARYASTRFPGKPLTLIHNKPMIQHVYERAKEASLDDVFVATDDERIRQAVKEFDGNVLMTNPRHASGTDRCAEVARILNFRDKDIIINIQGDEPFIRKQEINLLARMFKNSEIQIATLAKPITTEEELNDPNKVKVVFSKTKRALYFSRSPIPYGNFQFPISNGLKSQISNLKSNFAYKHLGIYAFRNHILQQITQLPVSTLEETEKLEQLRWLENDFTIHVEICHYESMAVDTPEDLEKILLEKL